MAKLGTQDIEISAQYLPGKPWQSWEPRILILCKDFSSVSPWKTMAKLGTQDIDIM